MKMAIKESTSTVLAPCGRLVVSGSGPAFTESHKVRLSNGQVHLQHSIRGRCNGVGKALQRNIRAGLNPCAAGRKDLCGPEAAAEGVFPGVPHLLLRSLARHVSHRRRLEKTLIDTVPCGHGNYGSFLLTRQTQLCKTCPSSSPLHARLSI